MTKDELLTKLYNLIDDVEQHPSNDLEDDDIEDLVQEAGIPITRRISCIHCWR